MTLSGEILLGRVNFIDLVKARLVRRFWARKSDHHVPASIQTNYIGKTHPISANIILEIKGVSQKWQLN